MTCRHVTFRLQSQPQSHRRTGNRAHHSLQRGTDMGTSTLVTPVLSTLEALAVLLLLV